MSFIRLHVHSQYSFLDGASSLDRLLGKAKKLDMPALAITDHNRLTGAVGFYEKTKSMGIKPIIGAGQNVVDVSRKISNNWGAKRDLFSYFECKKLILIRSYGIKIQNSSNY